MSSDLRGKRARQFIAFSLFEGLRHLQTAFTNFFAGRAKYPNFKRKHHGGNAEFTKSAFKWKDGKVYLAKCSQPLDMRWSRQLPEGTEPSTITVKLSPSGRWTVSLLVDVVNERFLFYLQLQKSVVSLCQVWYKSKPKQLRQLEKAA